MNKALNHQKYGSTQHSFELGGSTQNSAVFGLKAEKKTWKEHSSISKDLPGISYAETVTKQVSRSDHLNEALLDRNTFVAN